MCSFLSRSRCVLFTSPFNKNIWVDQCFQNYLLSVAIHMKWQRYTMMEYDGTCTKTESCVAYPGGHRTPGLIRSSPVKVEPSAALTVTEKGPRANPSQLQSETIEFVKQAFCDLRNHFGRRFRPQREIIRRITKPWSQVWYSSPLCYTRPSFRESQKHRNRHVSIVRHK